MIERLCRLRERIGPIGCAIRPDLIQLAQVRFRLPIAARIIAKPVSSASDARQLSLALEAAIDEGRFKGREAVINLPPEQMIYRHLHLAPMPMAEVAAAVHWQMAREMGWSLTDFTSGYYAIPSAAASNGQGHEVIAVAARVEHVRQQVELIHAAGLVPIAVDAAPGALARMLAPLADASGESSPLLLLDVGEQASTLIVIHRGRPISIRSIAFGRHTLKESAEWDDASAGDDGPRPSAAVLVGASGVAHEIMLCLHNLGSVEPYRGYVMGLRCEADAFTTALTNKSGILFQDGTSALQRVNRTICIEWISGEADGSSLIALGQALYGESSLAIEVAA